MILTRLKPAQLYSNAHVKSEKKMPVLEDFLETRDYNGAITLLEFKKVIGKCSFDVELWLAYCNFQLGNYKTANQIYLNLIGTANPPNVSDIWLYVACCSFYLGLYKDAKEACTKGTECVLKNLLNYHLTLQQSNDTEKDMLHYMSKLDIEDTTTVLSIAAFHLLRGDHNSALERYQRIEYRKRHWIALKFYIAHCYYKAGFYGEALILVQEYLQRFPNSLSALNLKACVDFRQVGGHVAESNFKQFAECKLPESHPVSQLINHNKVVFKCGEGALDILPPLLGIIKNARLNLALYYLKQEDYEKAYELMENYTPELNVEYMIKANAYMGVTQDKEWGEGLEIAIHCYNVCTRPAQKRTTLSCEAEASQTFLLKEFEACRFALNNLKQHYQNSDILNFNFGQVKASLGQYKEALGMFLAIKNEMFKMEYIYICWVARCYVMTKQSHLAWEMYTMLDNPVDTFHVLQVIANDCYKTGQFYIAAKAFHFLERLDPTPNHWAGKRGACCGLFQQIISGQESRETLREVVIMLQGSANPQAENIVREIGRWAEENDRG